MLFKEIMSYIYTFKTHNNPNFSLPEDVKQKFEYKLKEEWLHNPLLEYIINEWFTWVKYFIKKSLFYYDRDAVNVLKRSWNTMTYIQEYKRNIMFISWWKVKFYYSPFITYLYINDKLKEYLHRYLQWGFSYDEIPKWDKKYYAEFLALQNPRSLKLS